MVLLFDEPLIALKTQLLAAPSMESLRGSSVRPEDATVLEAAAPVYRRHVWLEHDAANVRFVASVQPLLARYGDALAARVARSYDTVWPATGVRADLVHAIQPGATAYTTNNPTHISVEVSDYAKHRARGTGNAVSRSVARVGPGPPRRARDASNQLMIELPRDLSHAVLTYNAGEITRRVLAESGMSGYQLYMDAESIFAEFRPAIGAHWPAFLDGRISRREALRRILRELAQPLSLIRAAETLSASHLIALRGSAPPRFVWVTDATPGFRIRRYTPGER